MSTTADDAVVPAAEPRYRRLAAALEAQIDAGTYRPGERIPSVRRLHLQHGVSITTVLEALRVLEDRGRIRSRPRSGYYVERAGDGRPHPEPGAPSLRARRLGAPLSVTLNLGIGNPQQPTLGAAVQGTQLMPITALNRLMSQALRLRPTESHSYDAPPGTPAMRRAVARRGLEAGYQVSPDEVVVTSGAKEAVYLSIAAVTRPGDTVVIESPAYYALLEVLGSLDRKVIEVPNHPRDGLDLDALARVLDRHEVAAVAMVSNFSNPIGSCMTDERKRALVDLLHRHQVPLVEDDVYGDLAFDGSRPTALKAYDRAGLVLSCGSFSKSLSPGMRVGWALPGRFQTEVEHLKLVINQATATAPQLAIAAYVDSGGFDRHLRRIRAAYRTQMSQMIDAIERHLPDTTRHTTPAGGHVLWVQVAGLDAMALHDAALAEGIHLAPGPMFSASGGYRDHFRLNTGFPWTDETDRQIATIGRLIDHQPG